MKVSVAALVTLVVVIAITVEESQALVCPPNACDNVKCGEVSCSSNQKFVKNAGFCGCCDGCVDILSKL
nr:unnamed protein product [Callosobruchus analis]